MGKGPWQEKNPKNKNALKKSVIIRLLSVFYLPSLWFNIFQKKTHTHTHTKTCNEFPLKIKTDSEKKNGLIKMIIVVVLKASKFSIQISTYGFPKILKRNDRNEEKRLRMNT